MVLALRAMLWLVLASVGLSLMILAARYAMPALVIVGRLLLRECDR